MSAVRVIRHKATVEVESDLWGHFTDDAIKNLTEAVLAACRAVNTDAAHDLAARITQTPS